MGYESLFTPFKIGNMEVKNRIGLSPMGTNSAFTNGRKDAQEIDYFIERAKGGTGILYMGCQMLNEQIAQGSMEGYLDTYTVLPSLTSVCDGCHRYGAKIVCQISLVQDETHFLIHSETLRSLHQHFRLYSIPT